MKIGIIGIGATTLDFTQRAVKANHQVLLNSPQGNFSYRDTINTLGINAKSACIKETAEAEIIILFLPWQELQHTLKKLPNMTGKIILHTNNALFNPQYSVLAEGPKSSCEIIAELLRTADIVKIFNVMTPAAFSITKENNYKTELFFSTQNITAKNTATAFLETLNFSGIDITNHHKPNLPN